MDSAWAWTEPLEMLKKRNVTWTPHALDTKTTSEGVARAKRTF